MDILGPLPITPKGNRYILTILDHFSRFLQVYPLKTISAEETSEAMLHYISVFGHPLVILTDNGKNFTAYLQKRLYDTFGIEPRFTSSYHPASNGKSERVNTSLKKAILTLSDERNNWEQYIFTHTSLYNGSVHSALNESPDMVMFGLDKNRFLNIQQKPSQDTLTFKAYVQSRVDHVMKMYDIAYKNLELAQEKQNVQACKKGKVRNIYIGQRVFLELGKKVLGKPKYIGPFRVLRKINDFVYEIQDIEKPQMKPVRVSVDRLYEIKDRKEYLKFGEQNSQTEEKSDLRYENEGTDTDEKNYVGGEKSNNDYQRVIIINVPHTFVNADGNTNNTDNQNEQSQCPNTSQEDENAQGHESIQNGETNVIENVAQNDIMQTLDKNTITKLRGQIKEKLDKTKRDNMIRKTHEYDLRKRK
jgi:hypothetical protein